MSSHLVIADIGSLEELREGATSEDMSLVEQFGSEKRQCEVLAWRKIVRSELGEGCKISYDEYGAPALDIPNRYISISHSKCKVAVLFSDAPCAVDIEQTDRDFRKVASRYLSEGEQALAEEYNLYGEMWCAKEALYKYHKRGNLDFAEDIRIVDYKADTRHFVGQILDGAPINVALDGDETLIIATIVREE